MKQRAFTLIELMIVLALLAILMAGAVPALSGQFSNLQRAEAAESLLGALRATRTEAISRNTVVTLRAIDGDWSQGWQMMLAEGSGGTVLRSFARNGKTRIVGNAKVRHEVKFAGLGAPLGAANGSFHICLDGQPVSERRVVLSVVGRSRVEVANQSQTLCDKLTPPA